MLLINRDIIIFFSNHGFFLVHACVLQIAATDALQKMASVLKKESTAGENFESLFDGAKSLVTGFGNMLRVSSHGARVYDSEFLQESPNSDKLMAVPAEQSPHKGKFGKRTPLFPDLIVKRKKRDPDNGVTESQLQVYYSKKSPQQ